MQNLGIQRDNCMSIKKIHAWTWAVQTHVVQGSAVYLFPEGSRVRAHGTHVYKAVSSTSPRGLLMDISYLIYPNHNTHTPPLPDSHTYTVLLLLVFYIITHLLKWKPGSPFSPYIQLNVSKLGRLCLQNTFLHWVLAATCCISQALSHQLSTAFALPPSRPAQPSPSSQVFRRRRTQAFQTGRAPEATRCLRGTLQSTSDLVYASFCPHHTIFVAAVFLLHP